MAMRNCGCMCGSRPVGAAIRSDAMVTPRRGGDVTLEALDERTFELAQGGIRKMPRVRISREISRKKIVAPRTRHVTPQPSGIASQLHCTSR